MRCLVTGGAGFIGSNLANELASDHEVIAIDDESFGDRSNLDTEVDFRSRSVLEDGLPTAVDIVFHLASLSSYGMHERAPARGARVTVEGFVNVVEQARKDGCETVVYASTSSVYGSQTTPTDSTTPVSPTSAYEAAKLARERYGEHFESQYGLSVAGMRPFSVYQGFHGAEKHKGDYANVISQFADAIAEGRQPEIYGEGTQTRDFIHVRDVVRGFTAAADERLSGVFNLGTGTATDFNSVVSMINDELGTNVSPRYVDNPIPEQVYVRDTCADCRRLRARTDWKPEIPLREGIQRVCEGYQGPSVDGR